jgi:large subunit ribosomal protein L31e
MISRFYTVPLKKGWRSKKSRRAERAVKFLRSFIARHMKAEEEKVKIDEKVNQLIWSRSMNNPPRKIRVLAQKLDDGTVIVSLPEEGKKREEVAKEEKKTTRKRKTKKEEEKEDAGNKEEPDEES